MERSNIGSACRDDVIEIIDKLIKEIDSTKKPLPMVTAIMNVTSYRGKIENFKALIRTKSYAGFERRCDG